MLHLRLMTPDDCTSDIVELLRADRAVATVAVIAGGAVHPPGDLVLVDVAREEVSRVLRALAPYELERRGAVAVETVDVALSDLAREAERAAPGAPEDALVWEEVRARTNEESELSGTYLILIVVATIIAACAIILDSPVLIVGAMVVGPEFGPLAGLAVAAVTGRRREAWRSLSALVVGFALAIAVTLALTGLARGFGLLPGDLDSADRAQTGFIAQPDIYSVVVAVVAGIAGMVSLTSAKSSALIGVLVSVTTVPAAAGIAVGTVIGDGQDVLGSAAQLVLNLVVLFIAATGTLQLLRWRQRARESRGLLG